MKTIAALCLFLASASALADCHVDLPLKGSVFVESCDPRKGGCEDAQRAIHDYMEQPDNKPTVLTIGLQTSPWRMYDADMRIYDIDEFAAMIRPHLKAPYKSVELDGSWTAVAPDKDHKSLTERVSAALGHVPVTGMDGFMWVASNGGLRTTHEAFSIRKGSGPYGVAPGGEVMASLVNGWFSEQEDYFIKQGNADGVMHAAAGWDIYYLCPDHALASFERAAKMGNAIAAYDAAMMHLDRRGTPDRQAAMALFAQAAGLGDVKAQAMLAKLKER